MQELDDYINRVQELPPAPKVLPKLLEALSEPDMDCSSVVELINYDPALTAKVLQACNSAFLGGRSVDSLGEAVGRLGFEPVFRIVAAVSCGKALSGAQSAYGMGEGELWLHSVTTAVASQLMAQDKGDDGSAAFTAGLLHDLGKIVLAQALDKTYAKLVEETESSQCSLVESEKKILGVHHGEIGGRLLARWKFPPSLVAAVWFHHSPQSAKPFDRLASFIYLGNMIAYFLGYGYGHQAFAMRGRAEALTTVDMSPEELPKYMIKTLEALETIEALLRIKP